jgi:hypothetical protein
MKPLMKGMMKGMVFAASLFTSLVCFAQASIDGVWAGKLEVAPGNAIGVHFTLAKDAAGAWMATLNSPDTGAIKNVAASSVSFDGSKLDIKVDALSGAYSGVLANGTFTGEWSQPGAKLAMNLAPYVASVLSEEAMATLLGQWHGKLQARGIVLNIVFNFERNEAGEFVGSMQQIDTGPTKIAMADISLENNELFFRIPQARIEYRAMLVDGGFNGSMKQGPQDMELNVVKGEYVAEQIKLALTDADYDKLAGEWTGTLAPPGAPSELTLVMTFKRDDTGAIAGTFQSPQQGNALLKITTASLAGSTLSVELAVPPAKFTGELDASSITGTWTQGPGALPLKLTKK